MAGKNATPPVSRLIVETFDATKSITSDSLKAPAVLGTTYALGFSSPDALEEAESVL